MRAIRELVKGVLLTTKEAGVKYGICPKLLRSRKAQGKTLEEAVFHMKNITGDVKEKKLKRSTFTGKYKMSPSGKKYEVICDCGEVEFRTIDCIKESIGCNASLCPFRGIRKYPKKERINSLGKQAKEYSAWRGAKSRCDNKNNHKYPNYGGRGITMSEEFRNDFLVFLEHVGRAPSPEHSLDRINNDGNYERGNLRWATNTEQTLNRRKPSRLLLEIEKLKGIIDKLEDTFNKEFSLAFLEGFI